MPYRRHWFSVSVPHHQCYNFLFLFFLLLLFFVLVVNVGSLTWEDAFYCQIGVKWDSCQYKRDSVSSGFNMMLKSPSYMRALHWIRILVCMCFCATSQQPNCRTQTKEGTIMHLLAHEGLFFSCWKQSKQNPYSTMQLLFSVTKKHEHAIPVESYVGIYMSVRHLSILNRSSEIK